MCGDAIRNLACLLDGRLLISIVSYGSIPCLYGEEPTVKTSMEMSQIPTCNMQQLHPLFMPEVTGNSQHAVPPFLLLPPSWRGAMAGNHVPIDFRILTTTLCRSHSQRGPDHVSHSLGTRTIEVCIQATIFFLERLQRRQRKPRVHQDFDP